LACRLTVADSEIPDRLLAATRQFVWGAVSFILFLVSVEQFVDRKLVPASILLGLCVLSLVAAVYWPKIFGHPAPSEAKSNLAYLSHEDSQLGPAIRDMAWYSSWGKWYAAQSLATNNHQPINEGTLVSMAAGIVCDALMDGELEARGRLPGETEYQDISKDTWRLAGLISKPHAASLWTVQIIPRRGVDPVRISKLLSYDSILVNSRRFESLWPRKDKKIDAARKRLLKKAREEGADEVEIQKLSQD
jgi:hypothetical protein